MRIVGRILRWVGVALGVLACVVCAAFGVLQTQPGKAWLARQIAQAISDPDFTVAIDRVTGMVPFDMHVDRIDIGDRDGTYLTLHESASRSRRELSSPALCISAR